MNTEIAQKDTDVEESTTQQLTFRRFQDGVHKWDSFGEQIFSADRSDKCPTYVHRTPPCQGSCPSGEDIRGWLQIVRGIEKHPEEMSMPEYAFQRCTSANPFPSMMGRVCPAPCQQGCNRNHVDDYVGINAVEQYIGDTAIEKEFKLTCDTELGDKKVAIIGGGPAGLSAAYHLRCKGYASTIFEEHEELGGMMRYGIPGYRTPRDLLDHEVQRIFDLGGIETRMSVRVGRDVTVKEVEKEFDAVLWCVGCQSGRALPVPGGDAPNCVSGVKFLEAFNEGRLQVTADRVICVGGGDTSIDVVSVARRLGKIKKIDDKQRPEYVIGGYVAHDAAFAAAREGAEVTLTSLFKRHEMTASEHEVEDALKEGVTVHDGVMPVEVLLKEDGRARALKMVKCEVRDNKPTPIEGTEFEVECDLIVSAIGQGGDLENLEEFDNGRGLMDVDKLYALSDKPGHFAAGDIIRPHLLTTAIGQGSIAANSIDGYLQGVELGKRPKVDVHHFNLLDKLRESDLDPQDFNSAEDDLRGTWHADYSVHNYEDRSAQEIAGYDHLYLSHFAYTPRVHRSECGPDKEGVLGHFDERVTSLTEEQAVEESSRCMSCGMCFECDNCVIFCPQDAVFRVDKSQKAFGRYVDTDYDKCIGCHICADVCPTGYIDMALGDH